MVGIHEPQPELKGLLSLLSQLAQYFVANEAKLSRHDCKSSIECLSERERFSLQRLSAFMCLNSCTGPEVVPVVGRVVSQHNCELSSSICPNYKYANASVLLERLTPDSSDDSERNLANERSQNSPNVVLVDASTSAEDHTANSHVVEQSLFNEASASLTASRAPVRDTTESGSHQRGNITAGKSCRRFSRDRRQLYNCPWSLGDLSSQDSDPRQSTNTEQPATGLLEEVISSPSTDVSLEPSSRRASVLSDEAERIQSPRATGCSFGKNHTDYDETGSNRKDDEPEDDEPEDDEPEDDEPEEDEPEGDRSHSPNQEILRGTNFETCSVALSHQLERILKECSVDHSQFLMNVDESCLPNGGGFSNAFYKMHKRKERRDLCKLYQRFECLNLYRLAIGLGYHTGTEWKWSAVDDLAEEIQIQYPHELFEKEKVKTLLQKHVRMGRRYNIWAEHLGNFGYLLALPLQVTPTEYTGKAFSLSRFVPAAVQKLKGLGIDNLVEELDLARLGNAITKELFLRSQGGRLRDRQKTNKRRKSADTEESRMPKARRLQEYRPTAYTSLRTPAPLPASNLRSTDDYQQAPTSMPYVATAPDVSLLTTPSVLVDHQGVSDPRNFCHPAPIGPMPSEHNLESRQLALEAEIILDSNINDSSDLLRGNLTCPTAVDLAYGRLDQQFFSSQEPARTGHLNGHTPCANWDIDMYPSWTYCHSEAAMKQFLAELDAKIRQDTLFC